MKFGIAESRTHKMTRIRLTPEGKAALKGMRENADLTDLPPQDIYARLSLHLASERKRAQRKGDTDTVNGIAMTERLIELYLAATYRAKLEAELKR